MIKPQKAAIIIENTGKFCRKLTPTAGSPAAPDDRKHHENIMIFFCRQRLTCRT